VLTLSRTVDEFRLLPGPPWWSPPDRQGRLRHAFPGLAFQDSDVFGWIQVDSWTLELESANPVHFRLDFSCFCRLRRLHGPLTVLKLSWRRKVEFSERDGEGETLPRV
jgi:hypothetical protein